MADLFENPMATDGFEFLEFTGPDIAFIKQQFEKLGFYLAAKHRSKDVWLYRQGDIHFIVNGDRNNKLVMQYANHHGPSVVAMGFRVKDANKAYERALTLGAKPYLEKNIGTHELDIPAIYGIGDDALIYFVDQYGDKTIYDIDFIPVPDAKPNHYHANLTYIDHVTHNVYRGNMDKWAKFYETLFNFREIRYFDIEGKLTGLISRAMTSPCGKIRIPINESSDDKSQIEEYLKDYKGEGIQHIALGTDNIYHSVEKLIDNKVNFLDTPDSYYDTIIKRVPWHQENMARLQKNRILLDGAPTIDGGLLLQIFTQNIFGPVFFEIIQRKGNEGFGEGNFTALFESIERDQIERGVLEG